MTKYRFPLLSVLRALCIAGLVLCVGDQRTTTAADSATSVLVDMDLYASNLKLVNAEDDGASEGRVTGVIPAGWGDNSPWAKAWVDYKIDQQDGQKYLAVKVRKIESGYVQFRTPIADYSDNSLFRLTIKARGVPNLPVEFGIRHVGPPHKFFWSQKVTLDGGWKTYEYTFNLDHNTQPAGFWFAVMSPGEADVASIKLERVSQDQLMAGLKAKYPDGGPKNVLRASRLPLGLQSGWTLGHDSITQNIEPVAAVDPKVIGVSGSPAMHLGSIEKLVLWSEPFDIPIPLQKYTASVYVKGTGKGAFIVLRDRKIIARQEFQAAGGWTRVELPFDPKLGGKMYSLRVETTGDVWFDAWQVGPGDKAEPYASQLPAEVSLACISKDTSEANVQFTDEPARMEYCVTMGTVPEKSEKLKLRAKVINLYGESAEIAPVSLEAKALNRGSFDINVFPQRPYGSLRVESWVENEKGQRVSTYQEMIVHRLQRPRYWGKDAPDSPFGTHVDGDTTHLKMTKAVGVNWVRFHDAGWKWIAWYALEREPGKWTFADEAIGRYRAQHLKILGCLVTAPEWASYFEQKQSGYFDRFFQPKNPKDYANYVKVVAERYKGVIDAYDIWNEPWNAAWFARGCDHTKKDRAGYQRSPTSPQDYVELSKLAYETIKSIDPSIKVIGINTTTQETMTKPYPDLSGTDWSKFIKELKGENYCDVLGYHQYESALQGYPGDIVEYGFNVALGPFRKAGVTKPAWFTEGASVVGYQSSGFYHYTLPYEDTENVMDTGNRLCREVMSIMSIGVEKSFIYSMACYNYFGSAADNAWNVLVTENGDLHASASAYSAMAWRLEDTKFVKWVPLGDGNFVGIFSGKGRTVAVVSPAQTTGGLDLPVVADWKVSDLIGNPLKDLRIRSNNLVYIETDKSPSEVEQQLKKVVVVK